VKLNIKTLAAAVALSAAAMSANAAIESNNGNSEFVFSAWDVQTGVGYTYDLNWNKYLNDLVGADLTPNTANNATLLANAKVGASLIGSNGVIFDDVLTGLPFTSDLANVEWNLNAFDNVGRTRMLITKDSTNSEVFASTTNQVKAAVTADSVYAPQADSFIDPSRTALADTYAITADTFGAGYAGNFGSGWVGNTFDTTNVLGSQSFLYLIAQSTQASSSAAGLFGQVTAFDGADIVAKTYLAQDGWHLQIAAVQAVPEPETYAMLIAGLGLMGFSARRRSK
jgi:hypothetical protein